MCISPHLEYRDRNTEAKDLFKFRKKSKTVFRLMSDYLSQISMNQHERWMALALAQANFAKDKNEVPVGAILVDCDSMQVVAEAHNESISTNDPTAHAEIVVLRKAAAIRQNYRLPRTAIYVTIEPCTMCVLSLIHI